jgi:formylglycine-generating enzyme required for sulfatase activity
MEERGGRQEADTTGIPEGARQALAKRLLDEYRADPDPGIHGAIDWLMRQRWGRREELQAIDKELVSPDLPRDRNWFINGQGQTFAVLRGDPGKGIEFQMGSTLESDPEREPNEVAHLRRIERPFAIALREVSLREYSRFLDEKPEGVQDFRENQSFKEIIPSADCAIGAVSWWEAARYCLWLSQKEGIPEAQWCFPKTIGPGMQLPPDYLERTGYRLPTEAEWEYACRARAVSSRPYGGTESWLPEYGWYVANSGRRMHPPGQTKPNDFGLFDALGNAAEWCVATFRPYPSAKGPNPITDAITEASFTEENLRILRGATLNSPAPNLRSAVRFRTQSGSHTAHYGFRPVRTYP